MSAGPNLVDLEFEPWKIKREVGISDAITLFSSLIIAYLLTLHAQQLISVERKEKDELMTLCQLVDHSLDTAHTFVRRLDDSDAITEDDYHELTAVSQELSKLVYDVVNQLAASGYYSIDTKELERKFLDYSNAIVNVESERGLFPESARLNERHKRNALSNALRKVKFAINAR